MYRYPRGSGRTYDRQPGQRWYQQEIARHEAIAAAEELPDETRQFSAERVAVLRKRLDEHLAKLRYHRRMNAATTDAEKQAILREFEQVIGRNAEAKGGGAA